MCLTKAHLPSFFVCVAEGVKIGLRGWVGEKNEVSLHIGVAGELKSPPFSIYFFDVKRFISYIFALLLMVSASAGARAQINTDQVMIVGRNALYFEDYILSIQYFNQIISAKPYLAQPYFFRGLAKYNLDDFQGAIADASMAIERNPFLTDAYELRAVAYQNTGDYSRAIDDYSHILTVMPESRNILFNMALAEEGAERLDDSSATFEKLLKLHSGYADGYVGRARLKLEKGDTVGALEDVDKALSLNKNIVNAYLIRADVAINSHQDYNRALDDMNEAIKLQPRIAGFYINRAFLRYNLDDYYGAVSDFDYAIQLEPTSATAYYNRALLLSQVRDFDKALEDLDKVIELKGNDYRALYNRAIVKKEKRDFQGAIADIDKVIEAYPSLAAGYFLRSEIKRDMGDLHSKEDFDRSLALAKQKVSKSGGKSAAVTAKGDAGTSAPQPASDESQKSESEEAFDQLIKGEDESQETVAARFSSLLTVADNTNIGHEFNNKNIRGKIQDMNMTIDFEPMFTLSYYNSPTELKPNPEYIREVDDINRTRTLRFILQVTNSVPSLTDEGEIKKHFDSVDYYNSYLSSHQARAIDYFGRAMDFLTLRNYENALTDFTRAIDMASDFTMAYFMRGVTRLRQIESLKEEPSNRGKDRLPNLTQQERKALTADVMADFNKVIELSPDMPIAHYNKGVLLIMDQDYTSALNSLNKAIELKPSFGEAYYNRGYVYFMMGDKEQGSADVSKSGELGVVQSYNLLKRMNLK